LESLATYWALAKPGPDEAQL